MAMTDFKGRLRNIFRLNTINNIENYTKRKNKIRLEFQ